MIYKSLVKPLGDYLFAFIAIILLSPIFLLISILLAISHKGSPFFFQSRPGKNAKIFTLIKFKTMNDKRDAKGNLLPDSERMTSIGRVIRSTSLDEIPQLINIIKGDMSLVGPRPLLKKYLNRYSPEQMRRHKLKPGITGLAQVSGRNNLSWDKRLSLDVKYVDTVSFALDVKIMALTFLKVIKREGISSGTSATMEEFKGTDQIN